MDLYDFTALVGGGKEKIVEYLQDARILQREVYCQPCQRDYTMVKNKVSIVGYMLRCPDCHRKRQLQTGTFLEGSRLQVDKFVGLLFLWAHEAPIKMVLSMTGVLSVTAVQWYQYFRDICSWKLVNSPTTLGGPGKIVQIDESVMVKASITGATSCVPNSVGCLSKRDAEMLLPIIQRIVALGTTIWSDECAVHGQLSSLGFVHETVNHSRHFRHKRVHESR